MTNPATKIDWQQYAAVGLWESCREWSGDMDNRCNQRADFILWGRLFKGEALGPRCYDHAAKHIGWSGMGMLDQYAVFDLRPPRRALGLSS